MKITVKMLLDLGACADQVEIFKQLWPSGAVVTLRRARRAIKEGLNLDWFAYSILLQGALDAYIDVVAPARVVYLAATAPALANYRAARLAEIEEVTRGTDIRFGTEDVPRDRLALEFYGEAFGPQTVYNNTKAAALVSAIAEQEKTSNE